MAAPGQTLAAEPTTSSLPVMAQTRRRGRPGVWTIVFFLAPVLLFVFSRTFFAPTDPDYWWHVRTGQYIVETGRVPHADIYSYTVAGQPWVPHEWLTEVLFSLVQRPFGYVGTVVLLSLVQTLTALAVYLACRWRGMGETGATLLMLWATVMALPLANVRPQMMTAFLLSLFVLLVMRAERGHPRALWALPPLMLLWVNLHGGYIIGLAFLGLTIAGVAIARVRREAAANALPLVPLLLAAILTGTATLLTPNGLEALRYPFSYAKTGNASLRYVAEWQSPDFHQPLFLVFAASLLLAAILGLGRRPLGSPEILWALAFGLMGLQSMRHIPLYAVVVTPLIGARLQEALPSYRRRLASQPRLALLGAMAVNWLLLIVTLAGSLASARTGQGFVPQWSREPNPAGYPAGAVAYLRAHPELTGNLFNEYHWGGYLIYELYPERLVFIDGRADVYGDRAIERYRQTIHLGPGWREALDQDRVELVLIGKESPLDVALRADPGWQEAYVGADERLLVRRAP